MIDGCQHGFHLVLILLKLPVGLIIVVLDQQIYQWPNVFFKIGLFEQSSAGHPQPLTLDIVSRLGCEWRKEYSPIHAL